VQFTVASAAASPSTARSSNARYAIQLNALGSFSNNMDVHISFTSAFTLSAVSGCSATLNGATISGAVCTLSSSSIVFSQLNIASTVSTLLLGFNTSTALYSGSFTITLAYYAAGGTSTLYNSNSALITITDASMACTLSSTSATVGATSNYTLTYTPGVFISSGSYLQVKFPAWSAYTLTNFPSGSASSICNGQCTVRNPNTGQGLLNEILTYSSLYPVDSTSASSVQMNGARNPASLAEITVTASVLYYVSSTSQPSYMTCTAAFKATTPGTFTSISFSPSNSSISGSSTISLFLSFANPISSISSLAISYGSGLQLSYAYVTSNQQTTQVELGSGASNTLLIGNLTNSTSQVSSLFMASFTLVNPPYASLGNPVSFLTQNLVGGIYYSIDSGAVSIAATVSTIVVSSASMSNASIGLVSNLSLAFTSVNALVSGSSIVVAVPAEVALSNATTCSCSIASTCALLNSTSIVVTLSAILLVKGSNISIVINGVINPATTTTTSSFAITSYYANTSTPVDTLSSGLTLTAQPVSLLSGTVSSGSLVVAAASSYTLTLQNRNPLPANSYLTVTFPSDFPTNGTPSLGSFSAGGAPVPGCSMSAVSAMKFNFSTTCFPSALLAQTTISILINGLMNPLSTKPTASLQLETYFNGKLMEFLYAGVTATMSTPTALSFASLTPASATANAQTSYVLALTFAQTHYSGDSVVLTIPSSTTLNAGFACTTSTSGLSLSCFKQAAQVLVITFSSSGSFASAGVTISNMQNNWYAGSSTFNILTTTNDSTAYYVEQGSASVTVTSAALTVANNPSNGLTLLSTSTLSLALTAPFPIVAPDSALLRIAITLPSDFTPSANCSSSLSGSTCSLSASTYTLAGLSAFATTINVTFAATAGYFTTSGTFLTKLTYNGSEVATDSSLTVSPYCSAPCKGCTSTPAQCTSCLPAPYTSNNYLYTGNSTCLTVCPGGYYLPSAATTCAQCDSAACLNCSGSATSCTACSSPSFLSNSSCVLACPDTFYGSNTTCVPCVNQCKNCSNITYCLSCVSGYSLNPDHTCLASCPSTHISLSQVCTACTSPCLSCSQVVTNCTSCIANHILFNSSCNTACPDAYYLDSNNQCQPCVAPCQYCTSAILCISCTVNHYLYNGTQCVSACPSGTYVFTSACQPCAASCESCTTTSTNCSSCLSGEYLYAGKCYASCPALTYPYQGNCTTCVSPCASCINGAFSCSTCEPNYLLLNTSCVLSCPSAGYVLLNGSCVGCPANCVSCASSTACVACDSNYLLYNGGCVASCPSSSPIVVNQQCTACAGECATCEGSPSNCLTCTVYFFRYSYTCVASCPLSYYSNELTFTCESGLSAKIVFFPVLITYLVLLFLLATIKLCCARSTSLPTVLAAFSGWLELVIWCYLLSLIFAAYLEPGINYALPRALILIAVLSTLICNVVHFKVNLPRLERDPYICKWKDVNVNHTYFLVVRYISLLTHHKFFRLIYSKLFNSLHFSMVAFKR
jgi:hypothetical protein